jgi:hypothetical protein
MIKKQKKGGDKIVYTLKLAAKESLFILFVVVIHTTPTVALNMS